ncbi:cupin domain-containing protein [Pararhizobium haloflavum]|uniref:cupin domain-containing protein n=1 Tax=Pararhizobium haloflavum TaxID=2037914 RepID=UPI000C1846B2|nr:cupin domain-containing protein [Pararhizobium haloflavum]
MRHMLRVTREGAEPESDAPDPSRVLDGAPRFTTWNIEQTDKGLFAGLWRATPGKWMIAYDEWEYFHVLEGRSVVTPDGGDPVELGPGDSYVLRPGFKGTWEVIETTLKEYVILS